MESRLLACTQCGHVYSGRVADDGSLVLPVEGHRCGECGCSEFEAVEGDGTFDDSPPDATTSVGTD